MYQFFGNTDNKCKFQNSIKEQRGRKKKEDILDYYYVFLHTLNSHNSSFLSTTTKLKTAKYFAEDPEGNRNEDYIIQVGWIPKGKSIKYRDVVNDYHNELVKRLGLPQWVPAYVDEDEICLKFGFLPHFMIGFITHTREDEFFVINPAILKEENKKNDMREIARKGLFIDQSEFFKVLKETNYKGYCILKDDGTYRKYTL